MRMFVAVWPDRATRDSVSALLTPDLTRELRLVRSERLHVTLRFLGEVSDTTLRAVDQALGGAAAGVAGPLRCDVGPTTRWFGGDRVLHVPVRGLDSAARAVTAATHPLVPLANAEVHAFRGHLTVARARHRRIDASVRAALAGVPFTAQFGVESFDLVVSETWAAGHHYTTVGRYHLGGGAGHRGGRR